MRNLLSAVFAVVLVAMAVSSASAQETIPNDVTVTFTVCLEGTGDGSSAGAVCVIGEAPEIGNWNTGADMVNTEGSLWQVDVTFASGSPASIEYKYKKDGCATWEGTGNRVLALPTDGTTEIVLDADSFNQVSPIGCGLSTSTSEEKTICFQVCMDGVTHSGTSCVIGSVAALGAWGTGIELHEVGLQTYQACVTFPAGTIVPQPIDYKFQTDDCSTWESLPGGPFANRNVVLTDGSPAAQTLAAVWNDGPGNCDAVPEAASTWSTLKGRFGN